MRINVDFRVRAERIAFLPNPTLARMITKRARRLERNYHLVLYAEAYDFAPRISRVESSSLSPGDVKIFTTGRSTVCARARALLRGAAVIRARSEHARTVFCCSSGSSNELPVMFRKHRAFLLYSPGPNKGVRRGGSLRRRTYYPRIL